MSASGYHRASREIASFTHCDHQVLGRRKLGARVSVHSPLGRLGSSSPGVPACVEVQKKCYLSDFGGWMDQKDAGPELLQQAIRAALEAAGRAGKLQVSSQKALEATLATLDEKLGLDPPGVSFTVAPAPDACLVVVHSSDPVAHDVVAAFLHQGGASKLGSAKVWLLPLEGLPVTRWARALRRVVAATRRMDGAEPKSGLPMRLTIVWSQDGEMMVASLG